jgi:hypothetical protein
MFRPALADALCQGDVFLRIPVSERTGEVTRDATPNVILLSHDCDIDKRDAVLLVCEARPITTLPGGIAGDIRRGRVKNAMHVPAVNSLPESFLDFRFIHRVARTLIDQAHAEARRAASMSEDGRAALLTYLYRFFARRLPGELPP